MGRRAKEEIGGTGVSDFGAVVESDLTVETVCSRMLQLRVFLEASRALVMTRERERGEIEGMCIFVHTHQKLTVARD